MSTGQDIDLAALPLQLRKLCAGLGVANTVRLLDVHGGTRLYIPKGAGGGLAELLGAGGLSALQTEFEPGSFVWLPMPGKIVAQLRNRQIRLEHARGDSHKTLAVRYGRTSRQVVNILAAGREPADAAENSLF